jgi:hypothetical protein
MGGYVPKVDRVVGDLEMMQNPEWWPGGFTLPLKKRKDGGWAVAVLLVWDNDEYYLFEDESVYDRLTPANGIRLTKDELQQVIDRGWVVD